MNMFNEQEFQKQVGEIVQDYLYSISSLKKHNYFTKDESVDSRTKYFQSHAFSVLNCDNDNFYVVKEEMFLEGCTRVFLINPIMKLLMDNHGIVNDWQYGNTFADFNISNREYELGSFLECIAVLDEKKVGIRYTKASYSHQETSIMERDNAFIFGNAKIPGFDKLCCIDTMYVLDWSGISNDELSKIHPPIEGLTRLSKDISIKAFFEKYFSCPEYELVISSAKKAIKKAKEIIALRAIPQLLPDNMLLFKEAILEDLVEERISQLKYEFPNGAYAIGLNADDERIIKDTFFSDKYRDALIGKSDFAKSFITSEYLFRTIKGGLSIDYTSIVVGYLKSVEQLLYLLYINAFEGMSGMKYWDRCNRTGNFDALNTKQYRYDPYNSEKGWMQEYYYHKKKTGDNAPEIGELTKFMRYYEKVWRVSEEGKEYIYECLDDFRGSCRNSHFHKDNIDATEYSAVQRIRNNAHICLYYLLGGFYFLNDLTDNKAQLGIIDYSFESLYQLIRQKRIRWFDTKFNDGSQCVVCYLNDDKGVEYSEAGELKKARLYFLRTEMSKEDAYISEVNELMNDKEFISKHSFYVSHDCMPVEMRPIMLKKKRP